MQLQHDDDKGYFVTTDGGLVVVLDADLEAAEREFALRLHLDDWMSPVSVEGNRVTVNPHYAADGISPEEAKEKVKWVKECLSQIKLPEFAQGLHQMTVDQLRQIGYSKLVALVRRDCQDEVAKGCHDLVNLIYTLTQRSPSYSREQDYVDTVREAWSGEPVDRREWYQAADSEYTVVTDSEADELWEAELDHYIDDCMDIPDHVMPYFNRERWKQDARGDGRAHSLSSYDGREASVDHEDLSETFYVFRQN